MDKKQELKDAYDKHQKTMVDITELEMKIFKFETSADFKKYENYTEEERKANFLEQYERYNQKEIFMTELDLNREGVIKSAKEYYLELNSDINKLQEKLAKKKRTISKLNKNIVNIKSEIDKLINSEKYKNNEDDIQSKIKRLETALTNKTNIIKSLNKSVKDEEIELKKIKKAKKELIKGMKDEYSISLDELAKEEKEQENDNSDIKQKQLKRGKNKAKKQNKKVKTEKEQPEEDNKDKNKEDEIDKEQVDDDSEVQPKQPEEDNKDKNKEPEQNNNHKKVYNKEKANANNVMYVYPQEQNNTNPQENSEQQTEAPKDENKKEQNNAPKKELKRSPKRAPTFKDEFAKIYDKARNNRLNWMDFEELVKIMKEPKNYDELNITTGIIFNKAKVIFKAMGEAISLSNLNLKDASERLEKAIEKSNAIISKDREALSADEKIEWDRAKQQIEQYNKLKETLQVYNGVRDSRMKPIKYFLAKFRKKEIKPLQASKSENNQNNKDNKSANSLSATLTGQVKTGDEIGSEVPPPKPPENNPPHK